MKKTYILLMVMLTLGAAANAQKKSGIISFSFNGKDRASGATDEDDQDLYFIYENSTKLNGERTTDAIIRITEKALEEYLGYTLIKIDTNRASTIPDQMDGRFWIMNTITEKAAFAKLGYEEAIKIDARIYSSSRTPKGHTPTIEITLKVIGNNGKTILKKSEKLKLKDEKVDHKQIALQENNSISLKDAVNVIKSGGSVKVGDDSHNLGVSGAKILDWYQQCLTNLLISKE
jgi:hypothetical protein